MTTEYTFTPKSPEEAIAFRAKVKAAKTQLQIERARARNAELDEAALAEAGRLLAPKVLKPTSSNNTSGKVIKPKDIKTQPPKEPDKGYKWNLPPHKWSLPVRPITVQPNLYQGYASKPGLVAPETYRRGRIWWYFNANNDYSDAGTVKKQAVGAERKYGFQFMWNPESYSTSVQLNTEITPHPTDRFAGVAGLFPSGESISLTLRLDRTNDFYCMRNLLSKEYSLSSFQTAGNEQAFSTMTDFYKTSFFANSSENMGKKIKDLMELGTIADLEYLFVAVNGPGWKNIVGRPTGDIGFLSATLLRIDIGPASYVGYINSLNVNHIAFSQDMTPIRTDVQISMNLMASAGLASAGTAAAVAPKKKGK